MEFNKLELKEKLFKRLDKYVRIETTSDENSKTYPSTEKQKKLANILKDELKILGLKNVNIDKYCYLTATLPSNIKEKKPIIAFLSHMDTSPSASGKDVKPKLHKNYNGKKIIINNNMFLDTKNCPPLKEHIHHDIITASGNTLLGADDKAGISIIMTSLEYLIKNPNIKHPEIKIAFTPDEEIGQGVKYFDIKKFNADIAYTIDGDLQGRIETENFNADSLEINITGKSVHPGSAKNSMANASKIAADIISSWPEKMLPETTEKYQGFIMFDQINSTIEKANIIGIIRDHDLNKLKKMEKLLIDIINKKRKKYPLSKIDLILKEQYRNMRSIIDKNPKIMKNLFEAVKKTGLKPEIKPIRGGTDGARLSFMGLPTPNIFTGGYNFHGPYEWVSLDGMEKSLETLIYLCQEWIK